MREICWDIGTNYPVPFTTEHLALTTIYPRLGYLQWHVREASVTRLQAQHAAAWHGAALVVRVYDVTDLVFDGLNAHHFFDIAISSLNGNYYLTVERLERNLLAEVGFRLTDNSFHALVRSNTVFFDRDRPASNVQIDGLFVGKGFSTTFPVENIFDAPVYEKMHQELITIDRKTPLSAAVIDLGASFAAHADGYLETLIKRINERCRRFGGHFEVIMPQQQPYPEGATLIEAYATLTDDIVAQLIKQHQKTPFDLIHCHDWYSSLAGIKVAQKLRRPLVLTLHSTEAERAQGHEMSALSRAICAQEKLAVQAAVLVSVPHSSTRQQVLSVYGAAAEKVVIVPDAFEENQIKLPDAGDIKKSLGLHPGWPLALFAGEISHAAGADLLMDALPTVCGRHGTLQFAFVGSGPLKDELQGRAWHHGLGARCAFPGDVAPEYFESILLAADFVVIPARTWQDEGLAQMAIHFGKPVLTTHQAHIHCIAHGQNGLVTYDNPGSIVWGLNEMIANPLRNNMQRLIAKRQATETQSLESIAVEQYLVYVATLKQAQGGQHV